MQSLAQLREQIDAIDNQIFDLFLRRTAVAEEIGAFKRANNLRVYDPAREREKVRDAADRVPEDLRPHAQVMMELLMEASRMRQSAAEDAHDAVVERILQAEKTTPGQFPTSSVVACQGIEGAYSQIAAERIFKHPVIIYHDAFEGVFDAVEKGCCDFGVLPIENSAAGSVNQVYDLMMAHDFHVVRTARIKVDHNLLAKPGASLEGIRHVYSHQQALLQCKEFLSSLGDITVHVHKNTAMAAQAVAESDSDDVAALSSRSCADLYGLEVLASSVQDRDNNYTRFACISKGLAVYPGADRTSLMLVLDNRPGSLQKVLTELCALDVNILKLESRPMPDRDFEYMFYLDIDCPVAAPEFDCLMRTIPSLCRECRYLGSYIEVV